MVAKQNRQAMLQASLVHLRNLCADDEAGLWTESELYAAFKWGSGLLHAYQRAAVRDEELVSIFDTSRGPRSRQNCWVLVNWGSPGPQVCQVRALLRIRHPTTAEHERCQADERRVLQDRHQEELRLLKLGAEQECRKASHIGSRQAQMGESLATGLEKLQARHAQEVHAMAVQHEGNPPDGPAPLRLAICKVYHHAVDRSGLYEAARVQKELYPVDLDTIDSKLAAFRCGGRMLFAKFQNLSKAV